MRPEQFELNIENYPFSIEISTRYADVDSLNHINNVAIAEMFEESRVRFGIHYKQTSFDGKPGVARLLNVSTLFSYLREVYYPAPVTIGVGVTHIGSSSHTLSCLMLQDNRPVAHARTILVRAEEGKSLPLPETLAEQLRNQLIRRN